MHIVLREMSSGRPFAMLGDCNIPEAEICSWLGQKAPGLRAVSPSITCYSGESLRALDFGVFSPSLRLLMGDSVAAESSPATHRPVSFRLMGPAVGGVAWHLAQGKTASHEAALVEAGASKRLG